MLRWLKFHLVGAIGVGVQLGTLTLLAGGFGLHYLLATGLGVEAAILHNFLWHQRWTWRDRTRPGSGSPIGRLLRFHLSTGAVSLVGNLLLMRLLVGSLGLHYLPANLLTIAACGLANFFLSHYWVFVARGLDRKSSRYFPESFAEPVDGRPAARGRAGARRSPADTRCG